MSFANLIRKNPTGQKVKIEGGISQGNVQSSGEKIFNEKYKPSFGKGLEYANKLRRETDKQYYESVMLKRLQPSQGAEARPDVTMSSEPGHSKVSELDELTSVGTMSNVRDLTREELTQVYQQFSFKPLKPVEHLKSIHDEMETILAKIEDHSVCIIKGPTGCGKSTQIPQFILDHYVKKNAHCSIVVTQPRRLAAITIAKHVCEQREWSVGDLVGYQVGLEKCANENTRLLYCTTGVLLEKLINTKHLNDYTHILLDEVHEREEDMDFLMLVIKDFLRNNSPNVKVVLMSATMDVSRFSEYFKVLLPTGQFFAAPSYEIKRQTQFTVQVHFLDDLNMHFKMDQGDYDIHKPMIHQQVEDCLLPMLVAFDRIDEEDFNSRRCMKEKCAVLMFLPGLQQIEYFHDFLSDLDRKSRNKFNLWLCPLHSSITKEEQEKVQKFAPKGMRKVILSTNIAESSLTIPDVKYVIDFCLTKHLVTDPNTGFSSLQLAWASHTNCIQREGRAGRVMDGRVYRMVPKKFYKFCMPPECTPEMQRCPLEIIVLKCKKLFEKRVPLKLISTALDPPDLTNYEKTILKLKEIGALLTTSEGAYDALNGDLTFMGQVMASLPLDIHITKLIMFGHLFDVLEETIIMGCAMSVRNVFSEPFRKKLESYNNKLLWADSSESDVIAYLNCYMVWRQLTGLGKFKTAGRNKSMEFRGDENPEDINEMAWARKYMVQIKHLKEVAKQEIDVKKRLAHFGIEVIRPNHYKPLWAPHEKPLILKLVLAGAFYPLYYSRKPLTPNIEFEAVRELAEKDPLSCVYLQNMPHPAPLYFDEVRKIFEKHGVSYDITLHYNDTRKLVVEFNSQLIKEEKKQMTRDREMYLNIPGDVKMAVYRAVKLRQLSHQEGYKLVINTKSENEYKSGLEMLRRQESMNSTMSLEMTENKKSLISDKVNNYEIEVTSVDNAGRFYCHILESDLHSSLAKIFHFLNEDDVLAPISSDVVEDVVYAAPFKEKNEEYSFFYRAKVKETKIDRLTNKIYLVEVFFIDYGNSDWMDPRSLHEVCNEEVQKELNNIPPLAVECVLCEVSSNGWSARWSEEANQYVEKKLLQKELVKLPDNRIEERSTQWMINVYSYVNGVASVYLLLEDGKPFEECLTLNKELIEKGYAKKKEEGYLSKLNHERRTPEEEEKSEWSSRRSTTSNITQSFGKIDVSSLPRTSSIRPVVLKGPNSPLEMKLTSLTFCNSSKDVKVEGSSVNSVLLDGDPSDPHERILVAGSVSQSEDGRQLTLHNTTVLPNMEGLAAFVCLTFAPSVEIRTDRNFSRFTGALCGLGMDEQENSLFPENDMEIAFDVEFTQHDLSNINKLRFWINRRLGSVNSDEIDSGSVIKTLTNIRDLTKALLKTRRPSTKVYLTEHPHQWGLVHIDDCFPPMGEGVNEYQMKNVLKLHYAPQVLQDNDGQEIEELVKYMESLRAMTTSTIFSDKNDKRFLHCKLCDIYFEYWKHMISHMGNKHHKELEVWLENRAMVHKIPFKRRH